jgi:hypothetical protein
MDLVLCAIDAGSGRVRFGPRLSYALPVAESRRRARVSDRASLTPRLRGGRSAGISDGNRDGNDGSRQRPETAVNSRVLSHIEPELGIRYA